MTRQLIIAEIYRYIRSIQDQELGACIDVTIPWGRQGEISVRVERMTGKCTNLHTDMEMLTIDPKALDAAFAVRATKHGINGTESMGAHA
ncbi:MAG: hypothetical protein WCW66_04845 [Patescibacteria group bacterium]|jgi:hypothetical protein